MLQVQEKEKLAVENVLGKGTPNVIVGASEAGKSTMISGLAQRETVYNLLSRRVSNGKGSLINAEIIVTDAPDLDKEKLYVSGSISKKALADISDDNDLLGSVLFAGALEVTKNGNYEDKIKKDFYNTLKNPANNSLAYKIAAMSEEQKEDILEEICNFSQEHVVSLYEEVKVIEKELGKKGQYAKNLFISKLKECVQLESSIQKFWSCVVNFINDSATVFIEKIKNIAYKFDENDSTTFFYLALGKEDIEVNNEIIDILLKSENGSKEYLFSKLSLVFRGSEKIFNSNDIECFTTTVNEDGKKIHVLRFIDTMGLFHEQGKEADDEYDRVIDILSEYHSDRVIFVLSADVNTTVKNGYEAMHKFFQLVNRDVKVYLISTKWDLMLQNKATQSSGMNRFSAFGETDINLEEVFTQSEEGFQELISSFRDDIVSNDSKKKPVIFGEYRYGLNGVNSEINSLLKIKKMIYIESIYKLINGLCEAEKQNGKKIRVNEPEKIVSAISVGNDSIDVSSIYSGLVMNKTKKLYASTVCACNRKWKLGTLHESKVYDNDYGYKNIKTDFVLYIGNYAKKLAANSVFLNEACFDNQTGVEDFRKMLDEELSKGSFGKLFAGILYEEAYKFGFSKDANIYKPQFERFGDMLTYVQNNYFSSKTVVVNEEIKKCFVEAVMRIINIIINQRCIVVY